MKNLSQIEKGKPAIPQMQYETLGQLPCVTSKHLMDMLSIKIKMVNNALKKGLLKIFVSCLEKALKKGQPRNKKEKKVTIFNKDIQLKRRMKIAYFPRPRA